MKRTIKVALAGNPNVGKTAMMNALAGTNASIGNWPGVTVERKEGTYNFRGFEIKLIDLPGIYSLTSYTTEERIAREFLTHEKYDVVVNILDISLLARNLYLTLELLELGIKPIIVLNKIDTFEKSGFSIDENKLSQILNLPVIKVSATRKKGLMELSEKIVELATGDIKADGFTPTYSRPVENAIKEIDILLRNETSLPNTRWISVKLLEGDPQITKLVKEKVKDWGKIKDRLEILRNEFKTRFQTELNDTIIKDRFMLTSEIAKNAIKTFDELPQYKISDKIDRIVTNPSIGIPIFFAIMWIVFKLTFDLSEPFSNIIDTIFSQTLPQLVNSADAVLPKHIISLVNNGILAGIGAVAVFLPVLSILYFLISILEDTGYMARAAALWDNFMRVFGLSGASVIPMILGFGCNVPAIYATRAMRSHSQKLLTILVIPWTSCSARFTVYALFVSIFFKENKSLIIFTIYIIGVAFSLILAKLLSNIIHTEDEGREFFIELPPYKYPSWNVIVNQTWIEVREFIYKAGIIIFIVSILIWFLSTFPESSEYATENTFIGKIGQWILPIFKPIGILDWKPVVALISGILAKEVVVGTLGTLYGGEESLKLSLQTTFSIPSAVSFMIFTLLYVPCAATIAAIKHESGSWKWGILAIAVELITAWITAFAVFNGLKLIIPATI